MLFNSLEYLIFLPTVFLLYWFVFNKHIKWQNLLLLVVSYIFYGWWDWRFLSLIVFSSFVDYYCGLAIEKAVEPNLKKRWLTLSMLVNLGFLGVFKYFNFFSQELAACLSSLGYQVDALTLDVILPVGISFYTFQTMSYTIDVYRGQLKPTKDIVAFFAFVSFFPQLVAGPIERATNLLPQFYKKRQFNYDKAVDGLRQILWGLFKKIVIADNCANLANPIFENSEALSGSTLVLGVLFFTFQIYGDFSGYSDIAIGTSKLFGFNLMQNFAFPYFSRDIAEFWRRWHISLSTWFRDYLYIPLGGSRGGTWMKVRNTFIIFLVSGFWHGANWTFMVWGALNALYFLPLLLRGKNRNNLDVAANGKLLVSFKEGLQILTTFILTMVAWVFFRANNINHAWQYLTSIISNSFWTFPELELGKRFSLQIIGLIIMFVMIEWYGRADEFAIAKLGLQWKRAYRLIFYQILIILIFLYIGKEQQFIYFQF